MATPLSKAYLLTKVLTASRVEVIVYLFEGAIGYLHRAREAMIQERHGDAAQAIDRAVHILIELSGGLNYTDGGALALRLDAIYNYLIETLTMASARRDGDALEACSGIMVILHDAWRQAAEIDARADQEARRERPQLRVSA